MRIGGDTSVVRRESASQCPAAPTPSGYQDLAIKAMGKSLNERGGRAMTDQELLEAIRADISGIKSDLVVVKGDMASLKDDMEGLKGGLEDVTGDIEEFKEEVKKLRTYVIVVALIAVAVSLRAQILLFWLVLFMLLAFILYYFCVRLATKTPDLALREGAALIKWRQMEMAANDVLTESTGESTLIGLKEDQ